MKCLNSLTRSLYILVFAAIAALGLTSCGSKIPNSVIFDGTTFKLIKSQSVQGSEIGYYLPPNDSLMGFSRLIMVSRWKRSQATIEAFDERYLTMMKRQGGNESSATEGTTSHCIVVTRGTSGQQVINTYLSTEKFYFQISLTRTDPQFTTEDTDAACGDSDEVTSGLAAIHDQLSR